MSDENKDLFDIIVLKNLIEAIGDSANSIVNLYLEEVPNNIIQMQQALIQDDLITVGRLAHSLKSSSASLGAKQMSVLSAELENLINSGETQKDKISVLIKNIQNNFDQVRPMFSEFLNKNS
jgi:HPt (histidine-containing phosphotransfer) domain-containing protein